MSVLVLFTKNVVFKSEFIIGFFNNNLPNKNMEGLGIFAEISLYIEHCGIYRREKYTFVNKNPSLHI